LMSVVLSPRTVGMALIASAPHLSTLVGQPDE
jgi:hypothetical protein